MLGLQPNTTKAFKYPDEDEVFGYKSSIFSRVTCPKAGLRVEISLVKSCLLQAHYREDSYTNTSVLAQVVLVPAGYLLSVYIYCSDSYPTFLLEQKLNMAQDHKIKNRYS